jgi:hypothetical protein
MHKYNLKEWRICYTIFWNIYIIPTFVQGKETTGLLSIIGPEQQVLIIENHQMLKIWELCNSNKKLCNIYKF